MDFKYLIILFFIYSFLGWLIEVMGKLIEKHRFINRGFLIGPVCPIYGVGCVLLTILLKPYLNNIFILFGMAIIICSVLEYLTSYIMEKLFKARWWDYSKYKYNINGRICLETMTFFGILGCIVLYFLNPFFLNIISSINTIILQIIILTLLIIFVIDITISSGVMIKFRNSMKILEKDGTEEITKMIKEIITNRGYLLRRLIKAFPNIKSNRERLREIRLMIDKKLRGSK